MKIKELERTASISWSPVLHYPILLAAGTAAQQLDASFSTSASLELFSLNLTEPGLDMKLKASVKSDHRFNKIVWGSYTNNSEEGIIIGGCDEGLVQMYNVKKLLNGEESLVCKQNKHTGSVHALDFNPFQQNLLATGASESEIYIWDLNNTNTPMTPGSKSHPLDDVHCLSWNRQVQHILATTFSTRCVVWDLRKNEQIIKLTDTSSHTRWKVVAWHPEVATQLCLASEEDQTPVIQMWDLRFATSPLKVLENHHRGVLSIAWCSQDSDLLISCGKDCRLLCWNPNSNSPHGEILAEIAHNIQWDFDVSWCPRNPALVATSNFDGHVSVYSLMGGTRENIQTSSSIADSFPGMDGYAQAMVHQVQSVSVDLKKTPKWLKRPAGASFGFGGKLVCFENEKPSNVQCQQVQSGQPALNIVRQVTISQVITEPELIEKSDDLEKVLEFGNLIDFCHSKADASEIEHEKYIWCFIKASFEQNPKEELLKLLGYKPEEVNTRLNNHLHTLKDHSNKSTFRGQIPSLNQDKNLDATSTFDIAPDTKTSSSESKQFEPIKILTGDDIDGLIAYTLILGDIEAAVELCIESNRMADALIIAMTGGSELLARTQFRYLEQSKGYVSSLISALVSEDWSNIINQCDLSSWKEALAAVLTYSSSEELPALCERLGERLETENKGDVKFQESAQLCYICASSFDRLITSWMSNGSISNPNKLHQLMEFVIFMQKALDQQKQHFEVTDKLAELLSNYANLLASQGNLNTALNYLGLSENKHMSELRERLYCNLGRKPAYSSQQPRLSNPRLSLINYHNNQNQSTQSQTQYNQNVQQSNSGVSDVDSNQQRFALGLPKSVYQQSWQNPNCPQQAFLQQSPKLFTPVSSVSPSHLPRPNSVSSAQSGSSLVGRIKYVVDPSVKSSSYNAMRSVPSVMSNPLAPVTPISAIPAVQTKHMAPYQTPNVHNSSIGPNYTSMMHNQNTTQNTGLFPPGQYVSSTQSQSELQNSLSGPVSNETDICNSGNIESVQSYGNATVSSLSAAPGWNDPPALSKSSRLQPKQEFISQAPITHPLFGVNQEMTPTNNGYGDIQQNHMQYSQPSQLQQGPVFQPQVLQYEQNSPTVLQRPDSRSASSKPKEEPLPEELMYMQTVFNELRKQCACAANNPQTKRKLEDVSKKLETLYDILRERKLSANTLSGLHQMVQMVQIGDYTGGLGLHTQLVSGTDFAQIACFMPGLKVLLQCALQLQVYIR